MDLQTILIGLAIFILSALLICLITKVTMREKTYEEVMAEQIRRQEEEREKIKSDKKMEKELLKKKYKKGKGDKSKEKSAQVTEPELKDSPKAEKKDHKMVNLEIEPEIIEPSDAMVLSSGPSKSRSGARKRSILHNKDEVTPVVEKAVELPHRNIKPLDDLELKKLHDNQSQETTPKKEKGGRHQTEARQEVKEVKAQKVKAMRVETVEAHQAPVGDEKKVTKAKSFSGAVEIMGPPLTGAGLVDAVRTARLTEREVQTLIEYLLNCQGATSASQESWNKKSQKNDPLALMKKQLEEKERALQEEQQLAMSANSRAKQLRNELAGERNKMTMVEKHFQQKMSLQEAELEALQGRLRHSHEQHMMETAKMHARLQQLENSGDAAQLHQVRQENKILQESLSKASSGSVSTAEANNLRQKVGLLEKELAKGSQLVSAAENVKKFSEDKIRKLEEQVKQLQSNKKGSEDVLSKRLEEMSGELRKSESRITSLTSDLKKATGAVSSAETECATVKNKLRELEKHLSASDANKEIGAKLQEAERKKQELDGNVKNLEKQLSDSDRKKQELDGTLKTMEKRLWETDSKRQELEGNLKNLEKQLSDSERKKQELDSNMKNLEKQLSESKHQRDDVAGQLKKVQQENLTLTQEVKVTKEKQQTLSAAPAAPNGDVHDQATSKHVIQISEHKRLLSEKEAELSRVQSELEVERVLSSQVNDLRNQLETQKQKNNELREKNWKAMDAVQLAEDKLQKSCSRDSLTKAVTEVEKAERDLLKRLFPKLTVSDKLAHKEWVVAFEKQAAQHQNQSEHSEKDRIQELETENHKLQQQTESYEKNFKQLNAETERLRHVEEENQRLKSSQSNDTSMSKEVSRLQAENQELQKRVAEKQTNITEAERKLHNLENVVETEEKKWKEKLRQAEDSIARLNQSSGSSSGREQELEELTIEQQAQIEHYRNVLSSTESVLRRLESAEKTWEEKQQTSQAELAKTKSELLRVQADLSRMQGELVKAAKDSQSLGNSSEMQGKVSDLEKQLRQSNERLDLLNREKEELTSKVIVLESQTKAVVQVDNEDIRKELSEVRLQLEGEQKKGKDLSSTLVRLNGIIKTGQDALSQEQKLVKQLQEQLSDKSKGSGASANQEIAQLRSKLSEKEKQLEREISANKQLSQRLGQLGVLGTSGNDLGTSV